MQGQDDNDATLLPLRDVHAINSRIEFGSVPISPVEVCTIQFLSIQAIIQDEFLIQDMQTS